MNFVNVDLGKASFNAFTSKPYDVLTWKSILEKFLLPYTAQASGFQTRKS